MECAELLTGLNVLIALIGVAFLVMTLIEYTQLRQIRKDFSTYEEKWRATQHRIQKAQQRVVASYNLEDTDQKIALLLSAVQEDPKTFNGYNALGYAYLKKGDATAAIDAFMNAVQQYPDAKEGYFDLAYVYLDKKRIDLCKKYLEKAIQVDPSSREDIAADERLTRVVQA